MREYAIRELDASTWDAFARLAEKHNGMGFGGCWCTWFRSRVGRPKEESGRPWKERLAREGNAHAALVFDGDAAVAWAQYGSPDELPNIHHRKDYEATRTEELPDYRITCIFVDRDYGRKGVAGVAPRWCPRPDREGGRGRGGGLSPGSTAGQEDFVLVSLQRHAQPLRADRLQLQPAQGQEPLRDAQEPFHPPRSLNAHESGDIREHWRIPRIACFGSPPAMLAHRRKGAPRGTVQLRIPMSHSCRVEICSMV